MSKTSKYDLFDNPMVNAAREAMPEEQKKQYEIIGKEMYGCIDFEKSQVLNNMPEPMKQAVLYIEQGLNSGLHPDYLDEDEVKLMCEAYGENWKQKFVKEDEDMDINITTSDTQIDIPKEKIGKEISKIYDVDNSPV
jgi:hypothetical protein